MTDFKSRSLPTELVARLEAIAPHFEREQGIKPSLPQTISIILTYYENKVIKKGQRNGAVTK
jgi:hypothetical protein